MRQRLAGQVGIEQRDRDAGARESEPDAEIIRAILEQQADRVTRAEALGDSPARVAMGEVGELAIAQRGGRGNESRRRFEAIGQAVDEDGQRGARIARDGGGALERPHP